MSDFQGLMMETEDIDPGQALDSESDPTFNLTTTSFLISVPVLFLDSLAFDFDTVIITVSAPITAKPGQTLIPK
ncbi:hypothetical protein EVAR_57685_1 [Eumeta japonica]|uniref:Uncharacterized protein n=1 Tax=Eumeta variegata TaxID=151549 RepID=A0A4C1YPT1_EUMVA|nr:hypothetical protein EVAR_57685_1 [Eumeta japonica]